MFVRVILGLLVMPLPMLSVQAQSPAPIVGQAVAPKVAAAPLAPAVSAEATLKTLQEIKAVNEDILRKQAATLQQLEEMVKTAEQIKIYTKRG